MAWPASTESGISPSAIARSAPDDCAKTVVVSVAELFSVTGSCVEERTSAVLAKGPLAVLAYSQDNKIKLDRGALELVDNQIIQTSGSVRLKAKFPNPAHLLWPGELVNLRLLIETRNQGLTVAAPVVQQGPQGAYAYVIKPDNTVESRAVTVAQISEGQALVDSGLKAGERVVVDGQSKLQPGSPVTILQGKAADEAARQSAQQADIP